MKKDWLKLKNYLHFSPKFDHSKIGFIRSYVSDKNNIISHRFFPLIHKTIVEKKYRRGYESNGQRKKLREVKIKRREIYYANHLDAQVYAFYARTIHSKLETIYTADHALNESVLAYRAIPKNENRNKSNIDFAFEIFNSIKKLENSKYSILCFDIKEFFDSLDHKLLKNSWAQLLGEPFLPYDHYNIYKSITKFSFVEISDILKKIPRHKVSKLSYLQSIKTISFCESNEEFRSRIVDTGIIKKNWETGEKKKLKEKGIPQGTPISAVLSNLYMLNFDKEVLSILDKTGGIYKRYSDDLLIICNPEEEAELKSLLIQKIYKDLSLIIQEEKTQIIRINKDSTLKKWNLTKIENGLIRKNAVLSYLGFEFDGLNIRIRQKGISKYYRNLKRLIRRKARYAFLTRKKNEKNPHLKLDTWIYRERIYRSKSHLGSKRKKILGKVFWGNYYSYVKSSSLVMKEPAIKKQLRNHWKLIEDQIRFFEKKYSLPRSKKSVKK